MAREGLPGTSGRNFSSPSFSHSASSDSSQSRSQSPYYARSPYYTRSRRRLGSYSRRSRRRSPYHDSSEDETYKRKRSRSNSTEEHDLSHNAHKCSRKEDRISLLPDSIISHILSFLPTQDAVQTGVLSKRWAYLWTTVPCLRFSDYRPMCTKTFVDFVNATLLLHSCSNVEKFSLSFNTRPDSSSDVNRWIQLMTQAKVKELTLNFRGAYGDWEFYNQYDIYTLPQHLYINPSLTKLELSMCVVKPVGVIKWDRLKSLSLGCMQLDDGIMRDVIEGCPLLEFLELYRFYGIHRLHFTNRSLRKLVIRDHCDHPDENDLNPPDETGNSMLEISAPYLQSLTMSGEMWSGKYRVLNATFLVDCCLNFDYWLRDDYIPQPDMLRDLLDDLRHAKVVTMGASFIRLLSLMELKGVPSPPSERKCLKLETCSDDLDLPGIAGLLKSSPCLENLVINLTNQELTFAIRGPLPHGENCLTSQSNFECLMLHLKAINITVIVPRNSFSLVLQLIEVLVKNARVLEKLTLCAQGADRRHFRKHYVSKELFEVAQKLLSFPRSSPHAVVTFSLRHKSQWETVSF